MGIGWGGVERALLQIDQDAKDKDKLDLARKANDRAEEMFLEDKRATRFELLKEYGVDSEERKKIAEKLAETKSTLISMNIPADVADYITRSGEGEVVIKVYEANMAKDNYSSSWIPSVIKKVQDLLGDATTVQAQAAAISAGLGSGENFNTDEGKQRAMVTAIYGAVNPKDFDNIDTRLRELAEDFTKNDSNALVQFPAIGNLNQGSLDADSGEIARIKSSVVKSLAPTLGQVVIADGDGSFRVDYSKFNGKNPELIRQIIDDSTSNILNLQKGPDGLPLNEAFESTINKVIEMNKPVNVAATTSTIGVPITSAETAITAAPDVKITDNSSSLTFVNPWNTVQEERE